MAALRETSMKRLTAVAFVSIVLIGLGSARAEDYPNKPIHWIVPYPPAGTTDILARIMGAALSEELGQQFIIDNRPGAGNNIGTEAVARATPDGYTILLVNPANGINATLYKKLNYNFLSDIAPVAGITRVPNVMEVTPSFPAKTVEEFIAYAKASPGKINMASSGNGTSVHMSGEMFMAMTGIKMTHVPYKGAGPALIDLISGTVDVLFDNMPSSINHIRDGKLRAIAVTTDAPSPFLPGVPTVGATVKGYEASAWFGIGVPKDTPPERIAILNKAVNKVLATDKMKGKLAELGGEPMIVTPPQFGEVMKSETEKWKKVVEFSGASID
jgi:tripartite-type tricarboxylate transporter receptor subunit TctC